MAGVFGVSKDEFVTSLAALVLYDGEAEITADNIRTVLSASNNSVAPYWPALFGNFLKNGNAERLVFSVGGAAAAAPAPVAAAAPAAGGAAAPAAKEKPKVEEVDALDGGMDMFGGGEKSDY